jgi:hypothetical protein
MHSHLPPARPAAGSKDTVQEILLGYALGRIGNPAGYQKDRLAKYAYDGPIEEGVFYVRGAWIARAEYMECGADDENSLLIKYSAAAVGMLLAPGDAKMAEIGLRQDGLPLPESSDTADTRPASVNLQEESHIRVDRLRVYALVDNRKCDRHVLEVICRTPGLRLYACTLTGVSHSRERRSPAA